MANGNPAIQRTLRDVSGTGQARRSVQQQFKKAGDVSKQRFQTERTQRQFQLSEKQRQLQRTAEEFRQDIQLAQESAKEDVRDYEESVRRQWQALSDAFQKARNTAADSLQRFSEGAGAEDALSGIFSGLQLMASGAAEMATGQDTGGLVGALQRQRDIRNQKAVSGFESGLTGLSSQILQRRRTVSGLERQMLSEGVPPQYTAMRRTPPTAGTAERWQPLQGQLVGRGNPLFGNIVLETLGLRGG